MIHKIICAYLPFQGTALKVPESGLDFSVLVYSIVACVALLLFFLRRSLSIFGKAELGGPTATKWASGILLVSLWFVYILLSAFRAYKVF